MADVPAAMSVAGAWLRDELNINPIAVGQRVVQGGPDDAQGVLIDQDASEQFPKPTASRLLRYRLPPRPRCARRLLCDPAPAPCRRRQPLWLSRSSYIAKRLPQVAPEIAGGRVIVAHLGGGASMWAIKAGKSVESTMGLTALDGLAMGTRPSQIDPGVVLYLMAEKGISASKVQDFLYRDCGLKAFPVSATTCANSRPAHTRVRRSRSIISPIASA